MEKDSLPYKGRLLKAKQKRFADTVLFVHFFEGSQRALLRHVKLVNDLGFDAVLFDLAPTPPYLKFAGGPLRLFRNWRSLIKKSRLPISSQMKFGMKHLYADQIENMLNHIPGKKIVYAFSNPAGSAIEALARRKCVDVTALVCDSGPTGKLLESVMSVYKHEWHINSWALRAALAPILGALWSPRLHHDIREDLQSFPLGFKILSIRGWKDAFVPPDHIDMIFANQPELDWRKLSLPEAGHLSGLRDCPAEYKPGVENFLREVSEHLDGDGKPLGRG